MRRVGPAMIIALALVGAAAPPSHAKERHIIRDESGRRVGTVEQGVGGRQVIRDQGGQRLRTVEPRRGGAGVLREASGNRTGTVERQGADTRV